MAISFLKILRHVMRFFDEIFEPVSSIFNEIAELVPNLIKRLLRHYVPRNDVHTTFVPTSEGSRSSQ